MTSNGVAEAGSTKIVHSRLYTNDHEYLFKKSGTHFVLFDIKTGKFHIILPRKTSVALHSQERTRLLTSFNRFVTNKPAISGCVCMACDSLLTTSLLTTSLLQVVKRPVACCL